ncbi:hypothetical protein [uncultured Litoreibacter sp.]|uniref:hypothetical protein n=1 Tax=uncultured Litoreibacter sp. TaxID=1392394 RepID=UPI002630C99F|nr:hypothetical protein [uncultured Litoreibacter sp.]
MNFVASGFARAANGRWAGDCEFCKLGHPQHGVGNNFRPNHPGCGRNRIGNCAIVSGDCSCLALPALNIGYLLFGEPKERVNADVELRVQTYSMM